MTPVEEPVDLHSAAAEQAHDIAVARKDILRIATAGSVDDGKSTLIGRLLYDSKAVFEDQYEAVERASKGDYVDLALLTEEIERDTRQDERRKLAGLLSHGVDTLVRVLAHGLRSSGGAASRPELVSWLAGYIDRRLRATAWLLDHWEAEPPLPLVSHRVTMAGTEPYES